MAYTWNSRVYSVFSTSPRSVNDRESMWMRRIELERQLSTLIDDPGINICMDGPSGTGKTSLARTVLDSSGRSYSSIEVTNAMDWGALCKAIIAPIDNEQVTVESGIVGELKGIVPGGSATRKQSRQSRPSDKADYITKVADTWSEGDVVKYLQARGLILVLDNLEQAEPTLVKRLSDLAKVMVDRGPNLKAKLLLVGTNDIYNRLLMSNESLSRRLKPLSVGAFEQTGSGWTFLKQGFKALELKFPGISTLKNQNTSEVLSRCIEEVHRAAGLLPKSLNELGKNIALTARGEKTRFVSASDIIDCADDHFTQTFDECKRCFPAIMAALSKRAETRQVFTYLFMEGVCSIHDVRIVVRALSEGGHISEEHAEAGLENLIKVGFFVRSGQGGQSVFTKMPEVAHVLGIILSNPKAFQHVPFVRDLDWQLELPGL